MRWPAPWSSPAGAWLVRRALLPVRDLARQAAASTRKTSVSRWRSSAHAGCNRWSRSSTHFHSLRLDNAYQQLEGSMRTSLTNFALRCDPDRRDRTCLSRRRSVPELRTCWIESRGFGPPRGVSSMTCSSSRGRSRRKQARRSPVRQPRRALWRLEVVEIPRCHGLGRRVSAFAFAGDSGGAFDARSVAAGLVEPPRQRGGLQKCRSTIDLDIELDKSGVA